MFAPGGGVGNASLTISSNDTVLVVTVFFWPFTMMMYLRGWAGPLWKCSSSRR